MAEAGGAPVISRAPVGVAEQSRIIGGTAVLTDGSAAGHAYPAYVQLRRRVSRLGGAVSAFTCGGCVVHAWRRGGTSGSRHAGFWVATAAHCLDPLATYEVNLWVGSGAAPGNPVGQRESFTGGQAGNAPGWRLLGPGGVTIYRHPAFDEDSLRPDVALIKVLLPAGEDLPATLLEGGDGGAIAWGRVPVLDDPSLPPAGRDLPVRIVGFGMTATGAQSSSPTLQEAAAVLEPRAFDWTPSGGDADFYHWVVGARTLQGDGFAGPWSGDSGGPLLTVPASPGLPPRILGVLCCVFWTGRDADLPRFPSQYARLRPFLGPAEGVYAFGLAPDSIWRGGMLAIIRDNSPTLLRSEAASPAGDAAAADFSEGNEWVEGGAAGAWEVVLQWLALMLRRYWPVLAGAAAVLVLGLAWAVSRAGGAAGRAAGGAAATKARPRTRPRSA
jgi:hypothetical protein